MQITRTILKYLKIFNIYFLLFKFWSVNYSFSFNFNTIIGAS